MQLKNTTPSNQSIMCDKVSATADVQYITVVGDSSLTLSDALWRDQAHNFKAQLEAGILVITEEPQLTKLEQEKKDADDLAKAEALIAKSKKLQTK